MARKPVLALLLIFLAAGATCWSLGQRMDIFAPSDALVTQKQYSQAEDLLQDLLIKYPKRANAIKDRIAKVQLLEADAQIEAQNYNEATATLSRFWALNPERADEAQKLINKINKVRTQYNTKAQELLAYMHDPKNRSDPSYNLEVTQRLDDLDKLDFNNPDSKKTITSLKETSLAFVNQDAMRTVMTAGRNLIDSGRFVDAARQYLKGFDLFKPEFENAGYDDLTVQAVAREVASVTAMPEAYAASQAELTKAEGDLIEAFASGDPGKAGQALAAIGPELDRLKSFRDQLFASGSFMVKTFDILPKEGKSPIEYQYLSYLDLFIRGRPDSFGTDKKPDAEKGKPEGMGGAVLAQTKEFLDKLSKAAQDSVDSAYAQGEKAYDAGSFAEAKAAFERAADLSIPARATLAYWPLVPESYFVPQLDDFRAAIKAAAADSARVALAASLAKAGSRLSDLTVSSGRTSAELAQYVSRLDGVAPETETRSALDGYRSSILATEASIQAEETGKAALSDAADAAAKGVGDERPRTVYASYSSRLDKAAAAAKIVEIAVADGRLDDLAARSTKTKAEIENFVARLDPVTPLAATRSSLDRFRTSILAIEASIQEEEAGKAALSDTTEATARTSGDEGPRAAFATYSKKLDETAAEAKIVEIDVAGGRLSDFVARYGKTGSDAEAYVAKLDPALTLKDVRAAMGGFRGSVQAIESAIQAEAENRAAFSADIAAAAKSYGDDRPKEAFADYSARLDKAAADARAAEFGIAAARGKIEADYIERELAARKEAFTAAQALIAGSPSTRPDRAGQSDPSPTQALRALDADSVRLASLAAWIADDLKSMGSEQPALMAEVDFAAARARVSALGDEAAKLQADHDAARAMAADKQKAAQAALASAHSALDTAKAKLADAKAMVAQDKQGAKTPAILKDFTDASERLDAGAASARNSFSLDFVASDWDDFNKQSSQTSQDVAQTKKSYVINETFRLLLEGQTYYLQGIYDLASSSLNAAGDLWRQDNDTDLAQVKYWQNQVRQASDTNNKLDVPESNPLYYDISSYLSEARKLYLHGDSLMKAGNKAEALGVFKEAQTNLNYVTSAFPLNEEAGFLKLQIAKSTDPALYKLQLPRNIAEDRALLATDSATAYSRILQLSKMEPDNQELKALLYQAEIDQGIIQAPPTKAQLAYAAAHVAAAKKLMATGRTADATQAEAELNLALDQNRGDPSNKDAINLLRDLQTLKGTRGAGLALGAADQAILDKATAFYAAGQYNQARDMIDQLLADPNKKTQAVLKLDNDLKTKGY